MKAPDNGMKVARSMVDSEEKFNESLGKVDFGLKYHAFCRGTVGHDHPQDPRVSLPVIAESIARLPVSFRYMKSENFFRHQEKTDQFTLVYHLSVRHSSLVEPMLFLKTSDRIMGDLFARLAMNLLKNRKGLQDPPQSELALRFSGVDGLSAALEFATTLYLEARKAIREAGPWS